MGLIAGRAHRVALLLIWVVGVGAGAAISLSVVVRAAEDLIWECDVVYTWRAVRWCLRIW